ncbi:response regulator [Candidatus Saganbacteria bacterium]|nr:response regulator [Candidatus Saganbacteria bacterium]
MAKILIIEDEKDTVSALSIRLKASGYEVLAAYDGIEGLDMARNEHPDAILLDIMLPKLDGYKVSRMLKFDEKYKSIPIIIVTAKSDESQRRMGAEVGADAYIAKPFNPEELMNKLKEVLAQKKEN